MDKLHSEVLDVTRVIQKVDPNAKVLSVERITAAGNINLMYKVTTNRDSYVIRGASGKFDPARYDKEAFLHGLAAKHGLPVPKVLLYDKTCRLLPFPFLLLEFKEGEMAERQLKKLSKARRMQALAEMGRYLARMHQIHFRRYGRIFRDTVSGSDERYTTPYSSWSGFYLACYERSKENLKAAKIRQVGTVTKRDLLALSEKIDLYIGQHKALMQGVGKPTLIHDDYRLFNILLTKQGHVSAILDFEMAKTGVPENELCCLPFIWSDTDPLKTSEEGDAFLEGYCQISKKRFDIVSLRKVYAPVDLFMEISYDLYHDIQYPTRKWNIAKQYATIRYVLGEITLDEYGRLTTRIPPLH